MVRVFKCHSFASQRVIAIKREPLTICADDSKVFVATSDCEIIVFQVSDGSSSEIQRFPTISQVDRIIYNSCKNYIATIELKKSWNRETKSVRLYLNWDSNVEKGAKMRTKVRVAGKSHVQHVSGASASDLMEIIELPMDGNATCIAACRFTGNFAVACGSETKLCSIVEKMVANSDKTYLDVEVFLELCWSFPLLSVALCEEFIIGCCHREVQGIRVRYEESVKASPRTLKKFPESPSMSVGSGPRGTSMWDPEGSRLSSAEASPKSFVSNNILFSDHAHRDEKGVTFSMPSDANGSDFASRYRNVSEHLGVAKDFSLVGMRPSFQPSPKPVVDPLPLTSDSVIVDDENFVEWTFQSVGGTVSNVSHCLPGLHSKWSQSQCHHHSHVVSPPVLSDFSGGRVKSSSGVHAETVLHLSDSREKEDWMSVILIPSPSGTPPTPLRSPGVSTNRMRSTASVGRMSMCCYVSGSRGGYLYQLSPQLTHVSTYKYTDKASQVGVSQSHLHVVTNTGIETYTSRWGAAKMADLDGDGLEQQQARPPASLDICLCGHEPFFGAVCLSVGTNFLALLSKVEGSAGSEETHWSLYILNSFSLVDMYKDMINFAQRIQVTGPASYIHLLQEAHLLLSTHPLYTSGGDAQVKECLRQVCRLLGDYYARPGQEEWRLCWPYYHSAQASVHDIVKLAVEKAERHNPREFGKGLLNYLDNILFSQEEYINVPGATCDSILNIYAVAAPEKLSQVILLSNIRAFSSEKAFHHLKTWLSVKSSASQPISTVDRLALVQLHLGLCDVEPACAELESMDRASLIAVCSSHPALVHDSASSFTPLAQLMRQHMPGILLDVLVEMLDKCVMSLDSLLHLLKSQSQAELTHNSHVKELLELVLNDEKRAFLFEVAVHMLSEMYMARIQDKSQPTLRQLNALAHQKFSLPQGTGHFAPRYSWLDYLPPFQSPHRMAKPCQRLEVKHMTGQGLRGTALPVTTVTKQSSGDRCPCCGCNESLLKLQSLLCSPRMTSELAAFILCLMRGEGSSKSESPAGSEVTTRSDVAAGSEVKVPQNECLASIHLLCLTRLDLEKATDQVVDLYPIIAGKFAGCCFHGSIDRYAHLLRRMEGTMKTCSAKDEELYVKAYKDLLTRMTELFPPAQFLDLLPADGNLYFLLPFLCASFNAEHTEKLKRKIVDMGKQLLLQS